MLTARATPAELERAIRNIPDFPKPGIQFKDVTPVLANPRLFSSCIDELVGTHQPGRIDTVVGVDARGFIFAAGVALRLEAGFVPVRKQGKLPFKTYERSYSLEYGSNTVAVHQDAFSAGSRVLLVDDLLATGGTAAAAADLVTSAGGQIVEAVFFIELTQLGGRALLSTIPVRSIVRY